jgi:transcriptional regulator with XRE-family HTH domain
MPRTAYRHDDAAAASWVQAVGERLRWARETAALSQTQAASLLGCDQSTWSQYERGHRLVSLQVALRASNEWGLTLDYLYRGLLDARVARDMAVRLAAAHPQLVKSTPSPAGAGEGAALR